ncbi:MAG: DUF4287 domain-containing protein [Asticcacaulis sp.]
MRASLERDTGKTLEDWVRVVTTDCPETKPAARQAWLKARYGILQNHARQILEAASPPEGPSWNDPAAQRVALWTDPQSAAILDAIEQAVAGFPGLVSTQRKGFTAWSKNVQFAALKPVRGGKASLGLAVPPDADPRLAPAGKEAWSERLKAKVLLDTPRRYRCTPGRTAQGRLR